MAENAAVSTFFHALRFAVEYDARSGCAAELCCAPSGESHARASLTSVTPGPLRLSSFLGVLRLVACRIATHPPLLLLRGHRMRTALPGISQVASLPSRPFRSCLLMFALFAWEERRLAACPPRFRVAVAVFPRNLPRSSLACAGLLSEPYLGPRFVRGSNHGSPYIVHVGFFLGGSAFGGSGKGMPCGQKIVNRGVECSAFNGAGRIHGALINNQV